MAGREDPGHDDNEVLNDGQEDLEEGVNRLAGDFVPALHNRLSQFLRRIISQKRFRFQYEGLDLDLAYITDRIIAVGYPSVGWEKYLRNTMGHTIEFLKRRHGTGKVKVFNLRGGYLYDPKKFDDNVIYLDMKDHHPPSLELMAPFCREAREWLEADVENVIAVHCKAGKGRTGVMICAFLIYCGFYGNPRQILDYYSIVRTSNNKGVTIPSQRRYIYYYNFLRENKLNYFPLRQELVGVYLERPPNTNKWWERSKIKIKVSNGSTVIFNSKTLFVNHRRYREEQSTWRKINDSEVFYTDEKKKFVSRRAYTFMVPADKRVFVEGDVRVDLIDEDSGFFKNRKIGHVWFNTMFVCSGMCGGKFVYGDKQWKYEKDHTSIGYKGELKHNPKQLLHRVPVENRDQLLPNSPEWKILKPNLWDDDTTTAAVEKIYTDRNIEPPRNRIIEHLHKAHESGIVKDDWNEAVPEYTGEAYMKLGSRETLTETGGPVQAPLQKNEHVLTFPVYEMDRALKNKKLDNGTKLHVVLRCIDSEDSTQSELAKAFCDKLHENTERISLQAANQSIAQYRPQERPADALGAEKKKTPAVRYAANGGYEGKPHVNLKDDRYKNKPFADEDRWCRYYYRQRKESESRWPNLQPTCPLTGKTFNFDTGNGGEDDSSPHGSAPGSSSDPTAPSSSSGGNNERADQTRPDPSGNQGGSDQDKPNDEGRGAGNQPVSGEADYSTTLLPEQMVLDDFKSYDKNFPTNDPLVKSLWANNERSRAAHASFLKAYRQNGIEDVDIENMVSPDAEYEPLEDPNFIPRGIFEDAKEGKDEIVDHVAAKISLLFAKNHNELERQSKECFFKQKARGSELDYKIADVAQRKTPESETLMKNAAEFQADEQKRLEKNHSKKIKRVFTKIGHKIKEVARRTVVPQTYDTDTCLRSEYIGRWSTD